MPPDESSILANFLLPPAPLPTILTLRQFTLLFPRPHQSNPAIPRLYRELQHQRAIDADDVKRNIAAEAKRGERQARDVARARRRDEAADAAAAGLPPGEAADVHMEEELFGRVGKAAAAGGTGMERNVETVVEEMEKAGESIEEETAEMESEADALLADIRGAIGDLSDLRCGSFNKPAAGGEELGHEALDALKQLQAACREVGDS